MRYFILFLCTKPAKSSVYFILTTQLISDLPPFKCSLITRGCWPPSWTALVPTEPWNLYIEQVVQMILMSEQVWKRLGQMLPRGAPNSHFLLEFRGVWGAHQSIYHSVGNYHIFLFSERQFHNLFDLLCFLPLPPSMWLN